MSQKNFQYKRSFQTNKFLVTVWAFIISSCAVGPDFKRPEPIAVKQYTHTNMESPTKWESADQIHYVYNKSIPEKWWELFNSVQINALIKEALTNNQDLSAAQATLKEAQANLKAISGSELPQINANGGITATRFDPAIYGFGFPASDFVLYNASVNVAYNLDIFGGLKRQAEASAAYTEYQAYQLQAAKLTLAANITTTVFKSALLNEQVINFQKIIQDQDSLLRIAKEQGRVGGTSDATINVLEQNLLQNKAGLLSLKKSQEQTKNLLAVYLGRTPESADFVDYKLDDFKTIQVIPLSVPAKLAYQRPDILAYEALLHEASAKIGVATANLYPSFNIAGGIGPITTQQGWQSFNGQSWIWSVGPTINLPIFNGGSLRAQKKAAIAAFDTARAKYKQSVLHGLQEVADCLTALDNDSKALVIQNQSYQKSLRNLTISKNQYKIGTISLVEMLNAQVSTNQALLNQLQAHAVNLADIAALFQALGGGGWWTK